MRATEPSAEIIAVVKANSYGHGAVQCSRVLLENGAKPLAVTRAKPPHNARARWGEGGADGGGYIGVDGATVDEVVSTASRRVPRVYLNDGEVIEMVEYVRDGAEKHLCS